MREAVQEPVVLFREGHPGVAYTLSMPDAPVSAAFDRRLITQAVTNLVKNATEAVESAPEAPGRGNGWKPRVDVRLAPKGEEITIEVEDNGVGLPKQNRSRLLEPYVTTKGSKGTGLGLAIVQKIVEQHGGTLSLEDAPAKPGAKAAGSGALVRITLQKRPSVPVPAEGAPSPDHSAAAAAAH
jgi:two-component system nitrogen regulation sensor histidine kinase NtrY